jgi:hypothetical protein
MAVVGRKSHFLPTFSLNQGQGSVFKIRECARSIPRIKLGVIGSFLGKKFFFDDNDKNQNHDCISVRKPLEVNFLGVF